MRQLAYSVILALLGLSLASFTGARDFETSNLYLATVTMLLAIGLYGSVSSIQVDVLRASLRIVISAVTLGVLLKAMIIGALMYFITREPVSLLLAVIVAQIDPLAVAFLVRRSNLSERAATILRAWSSFDDPMTVILSLYVVSLVLPVVGGAASGGIISLMPGFLADIGLNLGFAAVTYVVYLVVRRSSLLCYSLLLGCLIVAGLSSLMLGIAIIALFLRPALGRLLELGIVAAAYAASFMLGALLVDGIALFEGLLLAIAAIVAHALVSWLLTIGLSKDDRIYLSLAQQNGITAIILALLFEARVPGVVATIAPAILFINLTHSILNWSVLRFSGRGTVAL